MVAWVRELCGLQVLGHVNWLRFLSFYSNISMMKLNMAVEGGTEFSNGKSYL